MHVYRVARSSHRVRADHLKDTDKKAGDLVITVGCQRDRCHIGGKMLFDGDVILILENAHEGFTSSLYSGIFCKISKSWLHTYTSLISQ